MLQSAPCLCRPLLHYSMWDMTQRCISLCETWPNDWLCYIRHDPTLHYSMWDMTQPFIVLCETWPNTALFYVRHDPTLHYSMLAMTHHFGLETTHTSLFYVKNDSNLLEDEKWRHVAGLFQVSCVIRLVFALHYCIILCETWLLHTWDITHSDPAPWLCRRLSHHSRWDVTH